MTAFPGSAEQCLTSSSLPGNTPVASAKDGNTDDLFSNTYEFCQFALSFSCFIEELSLRSARNSSCTLPTIHPTENEGCRDVPLLPILLK